MKTAIIFIIPLAIFMFWHAHQVDSNQTEYCWDSMGKVHTVPNISCNH
jgi:hypothetical protein